MDAFTLADLITKTPTGQPVNAARIAYSCDGNAHTYDELAQRATRLALGLVAAGFTKGDRVAVLMRNRAEWIESFFGVTLAGGVLVPLNYLLRADELEFILTDSGSKWVVYEAEFADTVAELCRRGPELRGIGVDEPGGYPALLEAGGEHALPAVGPDDLALLQYTSGTTGQPKGVMHTHSTVLWNSYHQVVDFAVTRDDVCFVTPALCWAAGFHDLALATLWMGGRIVLKGGTSFDPAEFLATVEKERVTTTLLVPTVLKRVLAIEGFGGYDLSTLRLVISGGEPVPVTSSAELQRRLPGCAVSQVYGLSEFPTLMLLLEGKDAARKPGSTGKAGSAARVRVVDTEGRDVAPGETGEILCKSPAVMRGYYKRPEATAATLADGWLHTGDLATVDEEGYVFVAGRSKDMIITGGLNVYPAEVERVLAQHPAITEAAVIGLPDEQWGEIGEAHVVLGDGHRLTKEELLPWLRAQIATFKVPKRYVFRSELLPRTTSGKVRKFVLRNPE
jgi:fatty-acyl-CoA synthase